MTTRSSLPRLLRAAAAAYHRTTTTTLLRQHSISLTQPIPLVHPHPHPHLQYMFSTSSRRVPTRSPKPDIAARARQLQTRRLWTYALTFSCIAGFIVIVLNQFQDQLVFYITPEDAINKYASDPSKNKFRLGGLVLEGSVNQPASSSEMEFVITDLRKDILVRYNGSLPDLFREGHSVVVEGFVKPFTHEIRECKDAKSVTIKARSWDCYFSATEVLAKHDEKYMPAEVANALERNKKIIAQEAKAAEEEEEEQKAAAAATAVTG